jgi:hypothetical protein
LPRKRTQKRNEHRRRADFDSSNRFFINTLNRPPQYVRGRLTFEVITMIPEVPVHDGGRPMATTAPLSALLILPVPKTQRKPSLWMSFLRDLGFLLPAFGAVLGYLLLAGQAPFTGAVLITICPLILALRLYTLVVARREQRQLAAMEKWYREYRGEMESQWRSRYKEG